jgi:hypothetical protein
MCIGIAIKAGRCDRAKVVLVPAAFRFGEASGWDLATVPPTLGQECRSEAIGEHPSLRSVSCCSWLHKACPARKAGRRCSDHRAARDDPLPCDASPTLTRVAALKFPVGSAVARAGTQIHCTDASAIRQMQCGQSVGGGSAAGSPHDRLANRRGKGQPARRGHRLQCRAFPDGAGHAGVGAPR